MTHEDAIVISESAAKKFASEQMYEVSKERGDDIHDISKGSFVSKYPSLFNKQQLSTLDDNGVVKVGTTVKKGDPLILAVGKKGIPIKGSIMKGQKTEFSDASESWDQDEPGEVVDVRPTGKGFAVTMKAFTPVKIADKLCNVFGNKGVVSKIIPDAEMMKTKDGRTIDMLLNPMGVISRVNSSQLAEAALGKVAHKTGVPYKVEGFPKESIVNFALDELKKNGLSDTEDIIDPKTGKNIRDVFVGMPYFMKLHHLAESKVSARETGGYTQDELPAKGGPEGSKRIGAFEIMSLVSHGATDVMRDAKLVRGQRNDDYWQLYRMGISPPEPSISKPYHKFETMLQAAGVHLKKNNARTQILPATNKEIEELAGEREITEPDTVNFDDSTPVPGGLFDIGLTGGQDGDKWSHIKLDEPMPSPLMEDPIRSILGLTKDKFRKVLSGEDKLGDRTGPTAIHKALDKVVIDRDIESTIQGLKAGKKSARDELVKKLGFLTAMKRNDLHPRDFMLDKVPVIPPKFRPVSKFEKLNIISDMNYLYKDLMEANRNLKDMKTNFGDSPEARLNLYDSFKAIVGMGNPVTAESQDRNVRGLLKQITGSSPKFGFYHRKILGNPTDEVGRGVLTPDVSLDIDEVGMPVNMSWTMFKPFIIRRMARSGTPAGEAIKLWKNRDPRAAAAMIEEMKVRPVIINRAPSLHKFNFTAHFAKPVAGNAIRMSNLVLAGHGADSDGDAINLHVPVSEKAMNQAKDTMLPSKMLIHPRDYGVHLLPSQGYVTGLYIGSKPNTKRARTFATKADVIKAYRSGEIDADDPVVILRA
jgi:hypothetical protein